MAAVFGVYLGNSNFCIAVHKDGNTDVLANDAGDRVTPSILSFADGEKAIGTSAKQGRLRNASATISYVKYFIGNSGINIKSHESCTCKVVSDGNLKFEIDDGNRIKHYYLQDILVFLFQYMFDIGKRCCQSISYPAVISIPWFFSEDMKQIVRESASKAGFEVIRLISEPAAAALAYKIGQESKDSASKVLVFRLGGSSLDATVIEVIGGMYKVVSHVQKFNLGGDSITKCLVEYCCQEFQRQYKVNIAENKRALGKVWNAAEQCKQGLTTVNTAQCCAESVHDGIDLSLNISRARFEALIGATLLQCLEPIDQALLKASISKEAIDKVVLVGGSAKISKFQQLLKDKFTNAEVLCSLPPDEVLALGAAEEAALLHGKEKHETKKVDVLSKTIYLKIKEKNCERFYPVFQKGTPVPSKRHHTFHIPYDQDSLKLEFFEGIESTDKELKVVPLALVTMDDVGNCDVLLSLQSSNDGSLHITCTNKLNNKTESVTIEPNIENR